MQFRCSWKVSIKWLKLYIKWGTPATEYWKLNTISNSCFVYCSLLWTTWYYPVSTWSKCLHSCHSEIYHNVNDITKATNFGISLLSFMCRLKNKVLFAETTLSKQYAFVIQVTTVQLQHYLEQSNIQIHYSQIKARLLKHYLAKDNTVWEAT